MNALDQIEGMNMNEIARMPIKEFRERGYLHEVNRLLLHPLGLGLEIRVAMEPMVRVTITEADVQLVEKITDALDDALHDRLAPELREEAKGLLQRLLAGSEDFEAGEEMLSSVWDSRSDAEGLYFGDDLLDPEKAANVCSELLERRTARKQALGYVVQPVESDRRTLTTNYLDPDAITDTPEFEQ